MNLSDWVKAATLVTQYKQEHATLLKYATHLHIDLTTFPTL